tara:strand:- start:41 stop:442 length:402 start_codon:yes stop_codon:yes gene_type:complete
MGFFRRHEAPSDTSEQVDKKEILAQQQLELGRDIMDKLDKIVKDRAKAESEAGETGPKLVLKKLENNGGQYSVMLYIRDSAGDHFMSGYNIDLSKEAEELRFQPGPYDESQYFGLDQMDEFLQAATREIQETR